MEKLEVLRRLEECGVVAVVRGNSEEEVMKIIDACIAGGIIGIEVTFTVPGLSLIHISPSMAPRMCNMVTMRRWRS